MSAIDYKPDEILEWTGDDRFNAIYTIQLGELIENGLFDWNNVEVDWKSAAYDDEQFERVCNYFIERFYFREISIEPYLEWAQRLHYKIVYELMPKFRVMYQLLDDDFDITQTKARYAKSRNVHSEYPETLLSGNSDYLSTGRDNESEDVERGSILDAYLKYVEEFQSIDKQLLDELECMFIGLYTVSIDGV